MSPQLSKSTAEGEPRERPERPVARPRRAGNHRHRRAPGRLHRQRLFAVHRVVSIRRDQPARVGDRRKVAVRVVGEEEIAVLDETPVGVVGVGDRSRFVADRRQPAPGVGCRGGAPGVGPVESGAGVVHERDPVGRVDCPGDRHPPGVGRLPQLAVLGVGVRGHARDRRLLPGEQVAVGVDVLRLVPLAVGDPHEVILHVVGVGRRHRAAAGAAPRLGDCDETVELVVGVARRGLRRVARPRMERIPDRREVAGAVVVGVLGHRLLGPPRRLDRLLEMTAARVDPARLRVIDPEVAPAPFVALQLLVRALACAVERPEPALTRLAGVETGRPGGGGHRLAAQLGKQTPGAVAEVLDRVAARQHEAEEVAERAVVVGGDERRRAGRRHRDDAVERVVGGDGLLEVGVGDVGAAVESVVTEPGRAGERVGPLARKQPVRSGDAVEEGGHVVRAVAGRVDGERLTGGAPGVAGRQVEHSGSGGREIGALLLPLSAHPDEIAGSRIVLIGDDAGRYRALHERPAHLGHERRVERVVRPLGHAGQIRMGQGVVGDLGLPERPAVGGVVVFGGEPLATQNPRRLHLRGAHLIGSRMIVLVDRPRARATERTVGLDRAEPRLAARRIAVVDEEDRSAFRGNHGGLGRLGRVVVGELPLLDRCRIREALRALPGPHDVAARIVLPGALDATRPAAGADQGHAGQVARVHRRVVTERPGAAVGSIDPFEIVAIPGELPGAREGALPAHLGDPPELAGGVVLELLVTTVGKVDAYQRAAGVGPHPARAMAVAWHGALPASAGVEGVERAVELAELPDGAGPLEAPVLVARYPDRVDAAAQARELPERPPAGEEPDRARIARRLRDDPLRELVRPVASESGAPRRGAREARVADAAGLIAQIGSVPRGTDGRPTAGGRCPSAGPEAACSGAGAILTLAAAVDGRCLTKQALEIGRTQVDGPTPQFLARRYVGAGGHFQRVDATRLGRIGIRTRETGDSEKSEPLIILDPTCRCRTTSARVRPIRGQPIDSRSSGHREAATEG
ncbi:MAG: hypothetical protein BWX64_01926 [Acidobacteria bacterium ADurb.Bin051]|nr:MAG: hypothetical protein BWX64_01926 [Acidobacteria bacterium ADurb.Bin051]